MPTFKCLILPYQQKQDGSYNVKIRVTHARKVKYISTPYYADKVDISKRKKNGKEELKIRNQSIIDVVEATIVEYKKKLLSVGAAVDGWDVNRLVDFLTQSSEGFRLDFIRYGRDYVEIVKREGRESTSRQYKIAINALVRFIGREALDISEINVNFLKSFEMYLRNEPVYKGIRSGVSVPTSQKKKGRAMSMYMSNIKTIHETAKNEFNDEERGIINIPYSPFAKYKIPKVESSAHRTLTIEQMQAIIDYPYRTRTLRGLPEVNTAKDLFVLSFALMGINTADLYDDNIRMDGDFIRYNRKKTRTRRKDKAEMVVRIEDEIKPLIEKYKGKNRAFIFGEYYSTSLNFNKIVNNGLKKIGREIGVPDLTYYHARHTMASICANKLGVDIARVDEMLNHSDPKLALSRVYIERDFTPLWDANRRLLDLFDWSFYKEKGE